MTGKILLTAFNAVFPILALMALGFLLKQKCFLTEDFLKIGNKLVFNVCLPAMLFVNVYQIPSLQEVHWDMIVFITAAICLLVALGAVVGYYTTKDPARRGVVMQAVFRSNYAIIGIPFTEILGGPEAAAVAAVISAFAVPLFNIFSVIALSVFRREAGNAKVDVKKLLRDIIHNPLIFGVVAGLAALGIRQLQDVCFGRIVFALNRQTAFLYQTLVDLKGITTPLALIVLGGRFEFRAVKGMFREIAVGTCSRLVAAPVLGITLAVLLSKYAGLSVTTADYPALLALFGTPVAVSSAVMAGAMDNDRQLATQLVVWTSTGSIITLFAGICILMACGLLTV